MIAQLLDDRLDGIPVFLDEGDRRKRRKASITVALLRVAFAHCQGTRIDTGSGIGKTDRLKKTLNRAIFATSPMKREECDVVIVVDKVDQIILLSRIQFCHLKTNAPQSFGDRGT